MTKLGIVIKNFIRLVPAGLSAFSFEPWVKILKDHKDFFQNQVTFFDLETTGLTPLVHEIIEIAAIKIGADGQMQVFETLVRPKKPIEIDNEKIHGISNLLVSSSPLIEEVLPDFLKFIEGSSLVAHNASFDSGFLLMEAGKQSISLPDVQVYDSCQFAKYIFKKKTSQGPLNNKLTTLAEFFEISFNHHRAYEDSLVCAKIFLQLMTQLSPLEIKRIWDEKAYLFKLTEIDGMSGQLNQSILDELKAKIHTQDLIEIDYKGGTFKGLRTVKPLAILPLPQGLALFAECQLSKMNKSFKINKIKMVKNIDAQITL